MTPVLWLRITHPDVDPDSDFLFHADPDPTFTLIQILEIVLK
jgi:hypothetical protein